MMLHTVRRLAVLVICLLFAPSADAEIVVVPLELPADGLYLEAFAVEIAFDAGQDLHQVESVRVVSSGSHWSAGTYWCFENDPYELTPGPASLGVALAADGQPMAAAEAAMPWSADAPGWWMEFDRTFELSSSDWRFLADGTGTLVVTPAGRGSIADICEAGGWFRFFRVIVTEARLEVVVNPVATRATSWGAIKAIYR